MVPRAGTVVAYFAGQENTHRVRQVESGRRVTLAMWFTADAAWCEDSRLLEAFGELPGQRAAPIPSEMFLAEDGVDSRLERLSALGFEVEERSAGGGHVLRLNASAEDGLDDDEVVCADLTECLRLASPKGRLLAMAFFQVGLEQDNFLGGYSIVRMDR